MATGGVIGMVGILKFKWMNLEYLLANGLENLTKDSWAESWTKNGCLEYDPDWKRYKALEKSGTLRVIAAFNGDDLVGYASVTLDREFLDKKKVTAIVHAFFLSHSCRRGRNGINFLQAVGDDLRRLGVDRMIISERHQFSNIKRKANKLFRFLGYENQEDLWTKNLSLTGVSKWAVS